MALVRRSPTGQTPVGDVAAMDSAVSSLAPTVVEWLTVLKWPDGKERATGTLMVLAENGVWKAWAHDRDAGMSAWVSAGSLLDLLTTLEEGLGGDSMNWRSDNKQRRK